MPKILKILIPILVLGFILLIVFMVSTVWLIYYRSTPEYDMKDDFSEIQKENVTLVDKYDIMWNDFDNSKDIFEEYGYEVEYVENSSGKSPSNLKFNNYEFVNGKSGELVVNDDPNLCIDYEKCTRVYVYSYKKGSSPSFSIHDNSVDIDDPNNEEYSTVENEAFQKWEKDLNNMFDEYVKVVYGCNYQEDCKSR